MGGKTLPRHAGVRMFARCPWQFSFSNKVKPELLFETQYCSDLLRTNKTCQCDRQAEQSNTTHNIQYSGQNLLTTHTQPNTSLFMPDSCASSCHSFLLTACDVSPLSDSSSYSPVTPFINGRWKVPTEGNSTPNQISPTEKRTRECNKGKEVGDGADRPALLSIHTKTLSLYHRWRQWKNGREYWRKQKLNDRSRMLIETHPALE